MHAAILALLLSTTAAVAEKAADTVVVCPVEFRQAMSSWIEHRTRQGRTVEVVSNDPSAEKIRAAIRRVAAGGRLRFVVLVGDAEPAAANDPRIMARCVPAHLAKAKVNIHWGSEPLIATDNWYADLDNDQVPDVAIGRLSADSPQQLKTIVDKILAYERTADYGPWRRRVHFVAGVGGFGKLADSVLEMGAKKFITEGIPAAYATTMTYGSWQSPYCPDPRHFHRTTIEGLNRGGLFWVYIGHGRRQMLDRVRAGGRTYHIFDTRDVAQLRCTSGAPIAIFLSCYTGSFDDGRDCLAEEMLRTPGGPVAVFCGSRVTMPYAMANMATEMMDECFQRRRETIGEVILHAKRNLVRGSGLGTRRLLLDMLAKSISPQGTDLAEERMEHLKLFNLLGDPLLRLPQPKVATLRVAKTATAGDAVEVTGTCGVAGRCTVELVVRRDRLTFLPVPRLAFNAADDALTSYQAVYTRANDTRLDSVVLTTAGGTFRAKLQAPETASGPCHVRVYVEGKSSFAIGFADLLVTRPPQKDGKER